MFVLAILPLVFAYLVFVLFCFRPDRKDVYTQIRVAALFSVTITCFYLALSTEVLNNFARINFIMVMMTWLVPIIILTFLALKRKQLFSTSSRVAEVLFRLFIRSPLLWFLCFFLLFLAIAGIVYPPNNFDSMTYHMARVAHWEQNHSISHYQTHILRQLVYPPFAEWVILHLKILGGTDRLANGVQLFFFLGSLCNVSLLTKELGGTYRQQLLSLVFCGFIPMAVLQSTTTQNDLTVTYFVTAFLYLVTQLVKSPGTMLVMLCGITMGLAWLTKGTAFIYTLPVFLWTGIILIRNIRQPLKYVIKKAAYLALIPLTAFAINSPHFYRNNFLMGSALGGASEGTANEGYAIKPLLLVGIKNLMNHMPADQEMKSRLVSLSASWNVDINDPKYNYNTMEWMVNGLSYHEDYAQNFPHVILIILFTIALFFQKRIFNQRLNYYTLFLITIYGLMIAYCVMLKWQPWANRLQTPLFALFCVMLAIETGRLRNIVQYIICAPVIFYGILVMLRNAQHPILPIKDSILYNSYDSYIYKPGMTECKAYLNAKHYKYLGLIIGADSWDYPYYKLLSKFEGGRRTLKHVQVANESSIYLDDFVPEAIISLESGREKYTIGHHEYVRTKLFSNGIAFFEPVNSSTHQ